MPKDDTCEEGCVGMTDKLNDKADEIYGHISEKVSWVSFMWIIGGVFAIGCLIIAASYSSSVKLMEKAEAIQLLKNQEQDAIIFELRQDMKVVKDAALAASKDANYAAIEMRAHREYTEGKRR